MTIIFVHLKLWQERSIAYTFYIIIFYIILHNSVIIILFLVILSQIIIIKICGSTQMVQL